MNAGEQKREKLLTRLLWQCHSHNRTRDKAYQDELIYRLETYNFQTLQYSAWDSP